MSHTVEHVIDDVLWRCHHNPDLSGNVQIFNTKTRMQTEVPGELLITLVAAFVRDERIAGFTVLSDLQILGVDPA